MKALLSRLTNLSLVADVLQAPSQYISAHGGFRIDRENLRNDVNEVNRSINRNIRKYGDQKHSN